MATNDQNLIAMMKETIDYQLRVKKKRDCLMEAITSNIGYLSNIHTTNAAELKLTKERLEAILRHNEILQDENNDLTERVDRLEKDQRELNQKRMEIAKLVIDSQANAKEIELLHSEKDLQTDKMEKLNVEVQVVVTEKAQMKKELDRVNTLYSKLKREYKEQRQNFDLLVDELTSMRKQNQKYRGLILDNEQKLDHIGKEIQDLQKHIELKGKVIQRNNEELRVYKKQVEKLVEELRDKSDSESWDDEKERVLNVEKALKADILKGQIDVLNAEAKGKKAEYDANLLRMQQSLKYSQDANQNLKEDYDLMQDKFDKQMKLFNSQV